MKEDNVLQMVENKEGFFKVLQAVGWVFRQPTRHYDEGP
jgi:hypothetical protein